MSEKTKFDVCPACGSDEVICEERLCPQGGVAVERLKCACGCEFEQEYRCCEVRITNAPSDAGAVHAFDKGGEPTLEVGCAYGTLIAGYFGSHEDGYDGMYVELRRSDRRSVQCAVVETKPIDDDPAYGYELHALAWDGDDECPVVEQSIDPDGECVY